METKASDARGNAGFFCASDTERASTKETSQRHEKAGDLEYVGVQCIRCSPHGKQVWSLPKGADLSDVRCWKCGSGTSLVRDPSVRAAQSIRRECKPIAVPGWFK